MLIDEHKAKRLKLANWVRTNFQKEDTMKILFSDEKLFDIDGIDNSQNETCPNSVSLELTRNSEL